MENFSTVLRCSTTSKFESAGSLGIERKKVVKNELKNDFEWYPGFWMLDFTKHRQNYKIFRTPHHKTKDVFVFIYSEDALS